MCPYKLCYRKKTKIKFSQNFFFFIVLAYCQNSAALTCGRFLQAISNFNHSSPHSWNICSWPLSLIKLVYPGAVFCKMLLRRCCSIYGWFNYLKSSTVDQSTDPLPWVCYFKSHTAYALWIYRHAHDRGLWLIIFVNVKTLHCFVQFSTTYTGFCMCITHHNLDLVLPTGGSAT